MKSIISIFRSEKLRSFLSSEKTLLVLWMILAIVSALTKMKPARCNNFLIFKGVFHHLWEGLPLYDAYPQEYFDVNHYGPLFSLVIAPFALMPHALGLICWQVAMTLSLFYAIKHLPLSKSGILLTLWFCSHELLTALFMQQFNIVIAAIIIGSYILIKKERDWAAAFLILFGTFVKLYGIVGLAFFFFSRHKMRFIVWCIVWSLILFVAPMLISSPEYVVGQYQAWFTSLVEKNAANQDSLMQNISLLGFVHRTTGCWFNDLWLILPGLLLFGLPYLRLIATPNTQSSTQQQYGDNWFQLTLLASVLMFVVLFSSGSESSSYIIALTGVTIWYAAAPWKRSKLDIALLVFAFVLTSLSPSDLFPRFVREQYVQPYALKALPIILIWLKLCYEFCAHCVGDTPISLRNTR